MALTVEDGTGLIDADAFVSVEYCDTYCNDRELTDWLDGDADPDGAIRRATSFLTNSYVWKGVKLRGRLQAQAFPRMDVQDEEGNAVDPNSVPLEVLQACCELAAYERANPGALAPSVTLTDRVRREKIGPLEIEYVNTATSLVDARPVLLNVDDMISGLLAEGSASPIFGEVARS